MALLEDEVKQICKAHGLCVHDVLRRFVAVAKAELYQIHHLFDQISNDEFMLVGRRGYRIEKAFTGDGRVECRAVPGHFTASQLGERWVDRPSDGFYYPGEPEMVFGERATVGRRVN